MKSIVIYIVISLIFISGVYSQSKTDSVVMAKVDSMLYLYSRYGSFTENDRTISQQYIKNFKALFADNAAVFNDVLQDLYAMELLSVDEYSDGISQKFPTGLAVAIKNLEFGEVSEINDGEMLTIEVRATKDMLGITVDDDFLEEAYLESFIFRYTPDYSDFKLLGVRKLKVENKSLTLKMLDASSGKPVKEVKFILVYNNLPQQTRISDFEGMVYFTDIPPKSLVHVEIDPDADYILAKDKSWVIEDWLAAIEGTRSLLVSRVKEWTRFSLQVYGVPSMTQIRSTNVKNNYQIESFTNEAKFGYSIGVGASYAVLADKKKSISVGVGVGVDTYNSTMSFSKYNQNPEQLIDAGNDSYDLFVVSDLITDKINLTYLQIPVKVDYRKYFESNLVDYLFVSLGVSYGYLIDNSSELSGAASYYGYYQIVSGKEVDIELHNVEGLEFEDNVKIEGANELEVATDNLSALASFGISIPVVKDILNFDAGIQVSYGFSNISKYNYDDYYWARKGLKGDKTSLLGSGSGVGTLSYGIKLGVTYNIFK